MNPVSVRLLNQQLCSPVFTEPEEVVSHMCAIQAQEYRLMRWAVAMRTRKPSAAAFKRAFDGGRIVRAHLMRGTWQLIAAEDYGWMMDLFAPRAMKVIDGWMKANGINIPAEEYARVSDVLALTAEAGRSVTKEDFEEALAERGIRMDDHRLSYHIRHAEMTGILCNGDLLPMKASYSLVSEKLGETRHLTDDEALARLAGKYFRSHSPATIEDFIWWTGLPSGLCKKAVASLDGRIRREPFGDREFLTDEDCRTRGFKLGKVLLVPSYDEYLIGYKSRDIVLAPEYSHRAHNTSGNFNPIVVFDGKVCGNWKPFGSGADVELFTDPARPGEFEKALSAEWNRYLDFRNRL